MSRGARRAAAYSARAAYRSAARAASRAGRYAKTWARRNPMTTGFMAGGVAENVVRGARKRNLKSIRQGRVVKPRKAGPVPSTPSSRVPAKFAVAPVMTKFRKATKVKPKPVKSVITHYKEFGKFTTQKVMFINHEHHGSTQKMWIGIAHGLTKLLLSKAHIYADKSLEDPCIGPRTNFQLVDNTYDNLATTNILRLFYTTETDTGSVSVAKDDIDILNLASSPDKYRSFAEIAEDVATSLQDRYKANVNKQWLSHAQVIHPTSVQLGGVDVVFDNLDDAEIHFYVNSLVKFQNVTASDNGSLDKQVIDANPLTGRMYQAKGIVPSIDTELALLGNQTLDTFFMDSNDGTGGLTLCGFNGFNADDLGRISHIPAAQQLYGKQTVSSGAINMAPGAMKYIKTSFKFVKTFKQLTSLTNKFNSSIASLSHDFGRHTLIGLKCAHKHGTDELQIGWNRDTDVGCYIKYSRQIHNLKTNYTNDFGQTGTGLVITTAPTEHPRRVP